MYKMLIVDDNPWDRKGIQSTLDWDNMGISIVGLCINGKEAVEQFERLKPDIILADISMPVMNGIEMAAKIREINQNTKIIFMSCYDEFDFARSAIALDVEDYVLKPIIQEELEEAVKKAIHKFEAEERLKSEREEMLKQLDKSLPLYKEQFLRELFFGYYKDIENLRNRSKFLNMEFAENQIYYVVTFTVGDNGKEASMQETGRRFLISYSIQKYMEEYNKGSWIIYSTQISAEEFSAVFFRGCSNSPEEGEGILDVVIAMKEDIEDMMGIHTRIGVSKPSHRLIDVPVLYQQSTKAVHAGFLSGRDELVSYDEIEEFENSKFEERVDIQQLYRRLRQLIEEGEEEEAVAEFVDRCIKKEPSGYSEGYIKNLTFSIVNILQVLLIERDQSFRDILGDEILVWDKLNRFDTIKDVRQWLINLIKAVKEHLYGKSTSRYERIVRDMREVIAQRYGQPLTANEIAEAVYLSPSHANCIFKQVTGKTIFEYLTEYRMEKAKEMLKDPYSRIYVVSENVGYKNKSHFCLTFKNYTGLTPSEYKNKAVL